MNESLQCSVCGQWKRLTLQNGMQSFYPCCGEHGEHEHIKPVCDACCKDKCPYKPDLFAPKDTVVIYYIWWAMQRQDRWMWCAELNGKVIDYHKKEVLIKMAEEKGLPWIVVRHHKKGKRKTIVEKSTEVSGIKNYKQCKKKNMIQKFRKKPVVIEAAQYTRNGLEAEGVADWCGGTQTDEGIKIKTLEGVMLGSYGDWIIKGVNGEFYPCKNEIFEKTYEPLAGTMF